MFGFRKRLASLLLIAFSRNLRPHKFFAQDPRLKKLDEIFLEAIEKEQDPFMRARWDALRKTVLWLVTRDGAYRVRLVWLLREIAKNKKWWKVRPWEARF
jgi:hypothetical protein